MRVWGGDVDEGHEARVVSRGAACWTSKGGVGGGGHEALVHALPIPTLLAQLPPVVPVRGTRTISHRLCATCFPGGRRRRGRTRLRRWLADAVGALVARRGPWNGAVMWNPHAEGGARHRNRAAPAPPCLRQASVCHACRVCVFPGPLVFRAVSLSRNSRAEREPRRRPSPSAVGNRKGRLCFPAPMRQLWVMVGLVYVRRAHVTRTRWRGRLDAAMGQHGNTRPADACARASMAQGTRPRQERVAHGEGRGRQGRGRQRHARRGRRRMGVPGYKLHSAADPVEDRRGRRGRTGGRPRRRAEVQVEDRGELASREPAT